MPKNEENIWQHALNFSFLLFGWLVVPLVAALYLGDWLDSRYRTSPKFFYIAIGIAFLITLAGLAVETAKYQRELNKDIKDKDQKINDGGDSDK